MKEFENMENKSFIKYMEASFRNNNPKKYGII